MNFSAVEYASIVLPEKPCLASWLTFVDLGDDRLQFRGAEFAFTLRHPLFIEAFQKIQHLLDGRYTVEEIASSGGDAILPTTVTFLLKMLRAHGILHEAHPALSSSDKSPETRNLLFLSHLTQDIGSFETTLSNLKLAVVGDGSLANDIQAALNSIGIKEISSASTTDALVDWDCNGLDFLIACRDSPGFSFFEAINSACLKTGTRWMRVALEGTTGFVGPTVVPFQTACYKCYESRIDCHVPDLESHRAYKDKVSSAPVQPDEGYFQPLGAVIANHAAMEIARIFTGFAPPATFGRCYEFTATTLDTVGHDVLRMPRCPACHTRKPPMEMWNTRAPVPQT